MYIDDDAAALKRNIITTQKIEKKDKILQCMWSMTLMIFLNLTWGSWVGIGWKKQHVQVHINPSIHYFVRNAHFQRVQGCKRSICL